MPKMPPIARSPHAGAVPVVKVDAKAASDKWRGSASSRGYDSRWQMARRGFLRLHPLCVCCRANGVTQPAEVVDHVVPHRGDRMLFWDSTNWQALCSACHRVIKPALESRWEAGEVQVSALRLDRALPSHFGAEV